MMDVRFPSVSDRDSSSRRESDAFYHWTSRSKEPRRGSKTIPKAFITKEEVIYNG